MMMKRVLMVSFFLVSTASTTVFASDGNADLGDVRRMIQEINAEKTPKESPSQKPPQDKDQVPSHQGASALEQTIKLPG